ncbi:type II secretion system F family protein [Simiduia aestuariiviva]|uniref:MSHA biogenesis protein MshG n=1 Tax=Simiduia aestuariiviva TaxID=1510459 RepID=A0A839UQI2_9GAMM|nr:type II secretion system F family protein [Simiduia aestuariiviva]MBB3168760.1 MSHA biogenesis protein MshG [Simiduia aestuariiviva]
MPAYKYTGRDPSGSKITGILEGSSTDAIAAALVNRGITPLQVEEAAQLESWVERINESLASKEVDTADLVMFCRQMFTITKSGIPLMKGLQGLAKTMSHRHFKRALEDIVERLESGMDMSTAMRYHQDIFSSLFLSMVKVGESSGQLEQVFDQMSFYLERDMETQKSVKAALRYPMFVMIALAVAMVAINIWVIPAFADMFAKFDAELPIATQILLGVSGFFVAFWPHMLGATVIAIVGVKQYLKTEVGALNWGRYKLQLPIVGDILERATVARYCRSFALMLKSGVPIVQALDLCAKAIDNPYLAAKIHKIRSGIERGDSMVRTHQASQMFSPLVMQMIAVGEESGQVDSLLEEMASFYEREVDYDLKKVGDRIEPILIVVMAVFVAILALGIFLPMWSMYDVQKR